MRRGTLFWGAILILGGGLLLLGNLGIIKVNIWDVFWPLIIIALGISILWGTVFRRTASAEHVNIPLEGAASAEVRIRHGAGRMSLHAETLADNLLEGDFKGGLDFDARRSGAMLQVEMRVPSQNFPFFWSWPGETLDWNFGLNDSLPLKLDLETGANEALVDLQDLKVEALRLRSGASSTDLTLPARAGFTNTDISTGAASVRIRIPEGVAARIHARGGLASIHVNTARFPRSGDTYQSADYETAANKAEIVVETGVGSVDIR